MTAEATTAATATETHGRLRIRLTPDGAATVERITAESSVVMTLGRAQGGRSSAKFKVADTIDVSAFPAMLDVFAKAANLDINVEFTATRLSSSHVVLEDTALAIGSGIFEMLRDRMNATGINGAGSSLRTREDFETATVSAAVSVEGRKYVKVVSAESGDAFRWKHVMGGHAFGGVRTEDIDDFIDALAGGMRASFFLHERRPHTSPEEFWPLAIDALGRAISEAFDVNAARKGLPPGVKATLI